MEATRKPPGGIHITDLSPKKKLKESVMFVARIG
jgi:hypothetical protein